MIFNDELWPNTKIVEVMSALMPNLDVSQNISI